MLYKFNQSQPSITENQPIGHASGTRIGFVDKKSQTIYSWIDWIVSYNLLFSFLGNQTVAKYAAVQTISPETAEEYMALLTKTLERYIAGIIPKKFGIVWDGCTFRSEHYMAIFWVFRHDGKMEKILLPMAPLVVTTSSITPLMPMLRSSK
ncbi:hypothetical protein PC111_g9229 [Phytophthora cactorum]|nr:hypothetical protein PC111_g9229 [Phytophthora cactorum]